MKKLIPALAVSLLLTSCENPLNTMNEMKDTTGEMSKTTKGMKGTTTEMKTITENMYVSLRQQASEETRGVKWKELLSTETDKSNALKAAKVLFMSFEFQVWYGKGDSRGLHQRENRILAALEEMYMSMSAPHEELVDSGRLEKMSPLDLDKPKKNLERFFYSLAATMTFTNDFQEETLIPENKKIGIDIEEISVYDVIKSALLKEANGQNMTEAEAYVTLNSNRKMTIDLLNARISMLSALALKEFTDKDDMTLKEKARAFMFMLSRGRVGSLQLDNNFLEVSDKTRETVLERLEAAVKTKALLEEIGEKVVIQEEIKSVLDNLEVQDQDTIQINSVDGSSMDKKVLSDSQKLKELHEMLTNSNP